ncbi:MAG: hypothetical protein HQK59_16430 [Deltaproteobacteria bacterium]|nr:hypothetical protein [Deltaproteobacteria bacterium]
MPARTIEHVKGSDLPSAWLEKFDFLPQETFTVTVQPEDEDDLDYPPEEAFRPEFIAELKRRDREYDKNKSTICHTDEELSDHLEILENEKIIKLESLKHHDEAYEL